MEVSACWLLLLQGLLVWSTLFLHKYPLKFWADQSEVVKEPIVMETFKKNHMEKSEDLVLACNNVAGITVIR